MHSHVFFSTKESETRQQKAKEEPVLLPPRPSSSSFIRARICYVILTLSIVSRFNTATGFNFNSKALCPPSFAATEALRDLNHTKNQILKLTASRISNNPQAVLRKGSIETILVPAQFSEANNPNPCKTSKLYPTLYSPTSYMDLRTISQETSSDGFAFFKIKRKGSSFVTDSGLYIRSGGCDENTTDLMGCLDLDKDDASCCIRSDLKADFKNTPFFNLCDGSPQQSPDTSRLSTKRDALFAGLNLVKSSLPKALQLMLELRTKLKYEEIKKKSLQSKNLWSPPTPPAHVTRKDCIPLEIDLFHNPPTFKENILVVPKEFPNFEANVDTLTSYLSYLAKMQQKITQKDSFGQLQLRNNNPTALDYFGNLFADRIVIYTVPAVILTMIAYYLLKFFWIKIRHALSVRNLARNQAQNRTNLSNHFLRLISRTDAYPQSVELQNVEATAPFAEIIREARTSNRTAPGNRPLGAPMVVHAPRR